METKEFFDLPRWDGTVKGYTLYKIPQEDCEYWDMRIAPDGTIYYRNWETPRKVNVWCPGYKLKAHLHHLYQLKARYV